MAVRCVERRQVGRDIAVIIGCRMLVIDVSVADRGGPPERRRK